jgi:hypothetical protein
MFQPSWWEERVALQQHCKLTATDSIFLFRHGAEPMRFSRHTIVCPDAVFSGYSYPHFMVKTEMSLFPPPARRSSFVLDRSYQLTMTYARSIRHLLPSQPRADCCQTFRWLRPLDPSVQKAIEGYLNQPHWTYVHLEIQPSSGSRGSVTWLAT